MNPSDWIDRWRRGQIGFHEGAPNALLVKHAAQLGRASRVLVPLCGKAQDMAFLATLGHQVLGIELAEDAIQAFCREHDLTPEITSFPALVRYDAPPYTFFVGDIFACTGPMLGQIDAVYDRAALVALPPDIQPRYAAHLGALAPGARCLFVTLDYVGRSLEGPPFAVDETRFRSLFPRSEVHLLDQHATSTAKTRAAAVEALERCFTVLL